MRYGDKTKNSIKKKKKVPVLSEKTVSDSDYENDLQTLEENLLLLKVDLQLFEKDQFNLIAFNIRTGHTNFIYSIHIAIKSSNDNIGITEKSNGDLNPNFNTVENLLFITKIKRRQ